jgi:ribosomal protein S1
MTAEEKNITNLDDISRKEKFTGTVTKIMLAGAVIDIGLDVPGILHISQLKKEESVNKIEDVLEVGQTIEVWVKRIFTKKQRVELTMIEPLPLEWREIKEGLVVKGKVERLEKYGAFVEIGAERPGLVHISELAHGFIKSPEDAVKVGEEVEVQVLSVNRRRKQIKLSMKALMDSPEQMMKKAREVQVEDEATNEPVPTAMELAMRQAMEKSQNGNTTETKQSKKSSQKNNEMDGILSRTLERKVKTE